MTILRLDASPRSESSVSRQLTDRLAQNLGAGHAVVARDLTATPLPFVDAAWTEATNIDPAERTDAQNQALALSDALVDELIAADTLIIGLPVYNFGVPANLKAWIDQVCRARRTFAYAENGPKGLLEGKKAYIAFASGGVAMGSEVDMATPYLKFVLGFIGITDVEVIAADQLMMRPDAVDAALAHIDELTK